MTRVLSALAVAALAVAAFVAALAGSAASAQTSCRLALSLALDVSSSVDNREYALQTEGIARALTSPEVVAAFLGAPGQTVALHVFEWSGRRQQVVRQDWVMINSAEDLAAIADRLRSLSRSYAEFPTALGFAMGFGATALAAGPACDKRTLDIAGDGTNNDGFPPDAARETFPFDGVTVNGLVIGDGANALGRYFERNVIHGEGAFVVQADSYDDFEIAMRRKLVRELGTGAVSLLLPRDRQ